MRFHASLLVLGALFLSARAGQPIDPAEELFRRAERDVVEGDQPRAINRFAALARLHPKSRAAPRAQLRIAELYARNREFAEAFEAAQRLIDEHPESELFSAAMEIEFAVSERVMEEYRRRGLKNDKSQRGLPSRAGASDMLRVILANARQTEFSPRALFRLAATLDEEQRSREAVAEFNRFLNSYPEHPLADDAAFQVGFIEYRLARESNRERGAQERARLAFEDFVVRHPTSEKVPEAHHLLATLRDWETQRLVQSAQFYERRGDMDAALRTYRAAVKNDETAADSSKVQRKITELEPKSPPSPAP